MKKLSQSLLFALTLSPLFATASERFMDYFITSPGKLGDSHRATFERVIADIDARRFPAAEMNLARLLAEDTLDGQVRANLLADLGILKAVNAGADEGLLDITAAIELMEASMGPYDAALIDLLVARAAISQDLEAFEVAEESLRRAQHIAHRHDGVYTRNQLPIVQQLTHVHLAQGLVYSADREQRFNLKISEQVYGEDSPEIVGVLQQVGGYFANRGAALPVIPPITSKQFQTEAEAFTEQYRLSLFRESVELYDRAIRILEDSRGPNDLSLVPALKGLAEARLLQRTSTRYAEKAMERVLSIVESNPGTDIADHARALVDLGDTYTITADNRANDAYLKAWNLLTDNAGYEDVRNELFGTPKRIFPENVRVIVLDRQPISVEPGEPLFANVEFSVVDSGRVARVRVVDGNVPNDEKNMLRRHMRNARFRPRIVDGEIVATEGLMLHQTFEVIEPEPEFNASFETGP